jgi:hypothetical protein
MTTLIITINPSKPPHFIAGAGEQLMKYPSFLIFILTMAMLAAAPLPEAQGIYDSKKPVGGNRIVLMDGYAFVMVENPMERQMKSTQLRSRQLLGTLELVRTYCQVEMPPLQSPFGEEFTNILGIRPMFQMPTLDCNVVQNEEIGGKNLYTTAFRQNDLDKLKEHYSALPSKYSLDDWIAALCKKRNEVKANPKQLDTFLALLNFPERILSTKSALAVSADGVDLQLLYSTLAAWSPDRNSVYKAKQTLQVAPGFPPAMLVLANDVEKQGSVWEALNLRLLAQTALGNKQEALALCRQSRFGAYEGLLEAYFSSRDGKSSLPVPLWRSFGHCNGNFAGIDLPTIAKKAYLEKRPLEGITAANQLLRMASDSPENISLLIEGYKMLGLNNLAEGASWYLLCLENVPQVDVTGAREYLSTRYAAVLK